MGKNGLIIYSVNELKLKTDKSLFYASFGELVVIVVRVTAISILLEYLILSITAFIVLHFPRINFRGKTAKKLLQICSGVVFRINIWQRLGNRMHHSQKFHMKTDKKHESMYAYTDKTH